MYGTAVILPRDGQLRPVPNVSVLERFDCTPIVQSRNSFRDESFFDYGATETESQQSRGESLQNLEATTCSRSYLTSTNPSRSAFAESECKSSTADRKMKRPVKMPDNFDGKQPLWEHLMHFERYATING